MAEGTRIERVLRLLTGYGLANQPIATLATFQKYQEQVIQYFEPGIEPLSLGYEPSALPIMLAPQRWRGSN